MNNGSPGASGTSQCVLTRLVKRDDSKKPVVVYLHRYPIEIEAEQFPATCALLQLLSADFDVVYFSMGSPEEKPEFRQHARFEEIPWSIRRGDGSADKWLKLFLYYLYFPRTLQRLRRLKPAFIICKETLPFLPSRVVRLGVPALIDISDWWVSIVFGRTSLLRKLAWWIETREVTDWNRFNVTAVTHTRAETELMVAKGMNRQKLLLINAPQHEGAYYPAAVPGERQRLGLTDEDWVVAVHGIIHPSKGYPQILEWWAAIVKDRPRWKLVIIGGSGEEARCRRKVRELNLEKHVVMTGWLPSHADVNRALNAADCLLVTRRNSPENQGVIPSSLYHSLALRKPTVVTGLPGMSEVVEDHVNGFTYKPDDATSFREALVHVCDHPEEAANIAQRGYQTAQSSFDTQTCARRYCDLIASMVRESQWSSGAVVPP